MDIKQLTKKCSKCGEIKFLSEFYVDKRAKSRRQPSCKKCAIKWQCKNKEKILNYAKKYREENKEHIKRCREANKEKSKEYQKRYYEKNRERKLEQHKKYNRQHKDEISKYLKQWYDDNREKRLEQHKKYNELHRNEINARLRERCETDLKYKLNKNISRMINFSLKGNKNGQHWEDLVGYTSGIFMAGLYGGQAGSRPYNPNISLGF